MFLSMFYAKRFSAYYFNSIRKLCFSILENSNNNNKRSTHTFALYDRVHTTVPFTSFPHMYILWFEPCALCDIVSSFFFFVFLSFLAFFSFLLSIGEFIFSLFFVLFWCLFASSIFQHRTPYAWLNQCVQYNIHTALFYIYYIFHFGWILSILPSTIHHTHEAEKRKRKFHFPSSLFNVSSIFSYKILQTNQLNIAFEYFSPAKRELNKNCLRSLYIIIFIHRCCYCHHHLK